MMVVSTCWSFCCWKKLYKRIGFYIDQLLNQAQEYIGNLAGGSFSQQTTSRTSLYTEADSFALFLFLSYFLGFFATI